MEIRTDNFTLVTFVNENGGKHHFRREIIKKIFPFVYGTKSSKWRLKFTNHETGFAKTINRIILCYSCWTCRPEPMQY